MSELFSLQGSYERRCEQLKSNGIAVWDVLAESVRPGSMDADIRDEQSEVNDFDAFFTTHSQIGLVCFNGQKAAQLFAKLVAAGQHEARLCFMTLPSTSPAYASMPYANKLAAWRAVIAEYGTLDRADD